MMTFNLVVVAANWLPRHSLQTMRSTLAQPGPARPITVLLILLALAAGGAMAQNAPDEDDGAQNSTQYLANLANQVCCDEESTAPANTIFNTIACTDYPTGRVGRLWSGQTVCLSQRNGGDPKTAAGVLPCPRSYTYL